MVQKASLISRMSPFNSECAHHFNMKIALIKLYYYIGHLTYLLGLKYWYIPGADYVYGYFMDKSSELDVDSQFWKTPTTKIIFIVGENKSGKSYLQEKMLKDSDTYSRLISCTSRDPRVGEVEGVHYYFKSAEEIKDLIDAGETLQHVEFGGNYYCTTYSQYETDSTLLFVCTPDGILDTIQPLRNSGRGRLVNAEFSIIYCMASSYLLESRGKDGRSNRGNITNDFLESYNKGLYAGIPVKILSDSDLTN